MVAHAGVRIHFLDQALLDAVHAGITQVVLLPYVMDHPSALPELASRQHRS